VREISTTGSLLDIQFGQDIYVGDDVYIVEEIRKGGMALVALLARRNVNPDKLSYWLPRNIAVKVPLKQLIPPRIKGSQLPIKDFSSMHLHIHHFLSISIFLETVRKIDKVFDVRQNPSTDRTRMKLKL
jgi:hypothetical protein